jgi:carbon-monoxide dehydrogenase large subunit
MFGSTVERREDPALITGEAEYTDDISLPEMTHAAILRSQYAHARITDIDTTAARNLDGVVAVYTADDVEATGTPGELQPIWLLPGLKTPPYPMLAREKVRYQGQPIAVVVAEERYLVHDALNMIEVDYERLNAVTDPVEAVTDDAPTIHEEAPDNVAVEWEIGDVEATVEAFENAAHIVDIELKNQRLIPNAMEPRATIAEYRPGEGKLRESCLRRQWYIT